jgi:hypothetical protein
MDGSNTVENDIKIERDFRDQKSDVSKNTLILMLKDSK